MTAAPTRGRVAVKARSMLATSRPGPRVLMLFAAVVAVLLVMAGGPPGQEAKAAALVIVTVSLWASALISEALTALGFLVAAILSGVAPPGVVLSGLGSSAFWMVFSGIVIGTAIKATGLSARIAGLLARLLGTGQVRILAGVTIFGVLLAFLMPSAMGRVVLIVPILADLVERLGCPKFSKLPAGVMLAGILGTTLPSTAILPSNIPNNVLIGIAENVFHLQLSYSEYLIQHFPLLGLAKTVLLVVVLAVFHRDAGVHAIADRQVTALPLAASDYRLIAYLGAATLLWMTDGIHHISPAWVGLAIAVVCLLPGIGVLPAKTLQSLNFEPLAYVAGVVGLGAVISHTGLGHRAAQWSRIVLQNAPPNGRMENFLNLSGLSTLVGTLTTLPGVPAVLTPLTQEFSRMTGLSTSMVLATQVIGFSTLIFPYQAPPLVAALQLTGLSRWHMTKVTAVVALVSAMILWPLDYLWLSRLLGDG